MSAGTPSRSQQALTAAEVRIVERRRRDLPLGLWGMVMLIFTEGALFTMVLGTYWYLRYRHGSWPPPGIEHPKVVLPLVLSAVLVATSIPMLMASGAAREGRPNAARLLLVTALVVQGGYLATQIVLFRHDLLSFSPRDTAYGSAYFGMLALHHAHVAVGLLLDLAILAKLIRGLNNYRVVGLRAIAWYWVFVAAVGVPIALSQVSPSL
jgi:cytochrome c oxidase subunit III